MTPQTGAVTVGVEDDQTREGAVYPLDPFRSGARFGPYLMIGYVGGGGMGCVYRAEWNGRVVALKVPKSSASRDRLLREGMAGRLVNHPNVCRILDTGEHAGHHYLCMEYVEGQALSVRLEADGPLPVAEAVRLVRLVAGGMQAAHDCGVIHRDLKPSNVMVGADGQPKVVDFGMARLAHDPGPKLTRDGHLPGTPAYMAYEQFDRSAVVDHRADVYALGVVLYELLVGEPPYRGELMEVVNQILSTPVPPPPGGRRAEVNDRLDRVVLAALAGDRDRRWPSMTAFADALAWVEDPSLPTPRFPDPDVHPRDEVIARAFRLADRITARDGEGAA